MECNKTLLFTGEAYEDQNSKEAREVENQAEMTQNLREEKASQWRRKSTGPSMMGTEKCHGIKLNHGP